VSSRSNPGLSDLADHINFVFSMHVTAGKEQKLTSAASEDRGRSVGVESRSSPDLGSLFGSLGTISTDNNAGHAGGDGLLSGHLGAIESALLRQHVHLQSSLHF
jgi:hypothetical protein